ncbi:MAG: cell division protein ZapE [Pseudomonadota bacterium]|nr:cell division protein ZapE [Pseudomonadota bacterium]
METVHNRHRPTDQVKQAVTSSEQPGDSPRERYQSMLTREGFSPDPAQAKVVDALDQIYRELLAPKAEPPSAPPVRQASRFLRRRIRAATGSATHRRIRPVHGLYLWGGVGRGKTFLVDQFFECLRFPERRRVHFHHFMNEVHARLKDLQQQQDPLRTVARDIAKTTRVLCFDEFFVSDITDAMLLGTLFEHLFQMGVTLIATSNVPPDDLYKNGLQRERFIPAIELIKQNTRVMHIDDGTDYRLRQLDAAEIYHSPLDDEAEANLLKYFEQITPDEGQLDTMLTVEDRPITVRGLGDGVAWFDFPAICEGPRSQRDYLEIARCHHTVLIGQVPVMGREDENAARRFIHLVDVFYDRSVKLIISAAKPPEAIYEGEKLRFEFQRTLSRLQEMQSHAYLAQQHRP